jgi:hypothetical protein
LRPSAIIAELAGILVRDEELRHERNAHAYKAKLGCEKGSSNTETEVGWQEDCEKESAQGGRRRGVVHDGKVGFDVAASSCRPDNGKSAAVNAEAAKARKRQLVVERLWQGARRISDARKGAITDG